MILTRVDLVRLYLRRYPRVCLGLYSTVGAVAVALTHWLQGG